MNNSNFYGIVVEKYGKRKLTTKERVMIFDDKELSYYPIPNDKQARNYRARRKSKKRTVLFHL